MNKAKIKNISGKILLLILFFFIGKFFKNNLSLIVNYDYRINFPYLIILILFLFYTAIFPVIAWRFLVLKLGGRIGFKKSLNIWFLSNLGRYIPGKIWQFAGLVVLSKKENISKKISLQTIIYGQFAANLIGITLFIFLFRDLKNYPLYLLYPLFALYPILLIPNFLKKILNGLLKLFKRAERIENSLDFGSILSYFLMQIVNWINIGASLILTVLAFSNIELATIANMNFLFILPAAWTIGLLSFFAPGGIGVRESLMTILLQRYIPLELAIVLPWIHRILISLVELIATLGAYFLNKKNGN